MASERNSDRPAAIHPMSCVNNKELFDDNFFKHARATIKARMQIQKWSGDMLIGHMAFEEYSYPQHSYCLFTIQHSSSKWIFPVYMVRSQGNIESGLAAKLIYGLLEELLNLGIVIRCVMCPRIKHLCETYKMLGLNLETRDLDMAELKIKNQVVNFFYDFKVVVSLNPVKQILALLNEQREVRPAN